MLIGKTKGTFLIREKCLFIYIQGIIYAEINCLCYYWIFRSIDRWSAWNGVRGNIYLAFTNVWYRTSVASASVHLAEVVTTAASGASHIKFGNVDKYTVLLTLPEQLAHLLSMFLSNLPGDVIKPYISVFLFTLGVYILLRFIIQNKLLLQINVCRLNNLFRLAYSLDSLIQLVVGLGSDYDTCTSSKRK